MFGRNRLIRTGREIGPKTITAIPKEPLNVPGVGELAAFTPTNPSYTFGLTKCDADSHYYFCGMAPYILNAWRDPYIYKYNPVTNKIVQKRRISVLINSVDSHRLACIATDSSGHIYVVFEELIDGGTHGSPVRLYKTTVAGDLNTLALLQTFSGRWTYPTILIDGSNVFISARGSTGASFIRGQYWYWKSTNSGTSFGSPVKLYDSDNEDDEVAYCWLQYDYTTSNIHVILNERNNTISNWTFVAHMRGTMNSNVWTNQSGSFSKNVSSSGALTRAEWVANGMVYESNNYSTQTVNHEGGVCKSDGSIKIMVSVQTPTGVTYEGNPETELDELRWYYWNGSSWAYNTVDLPATPIQFYWAYERWWHVVNNDTAYDEIIFMDPTSNNDVYIKRSTDNFATETDKLILPGNGKWRMGAITVNSTNESDRVLLFTNTQGDPFQINSETRLDYSNLLVLFPYEFSKYS